MNWKAGLRDNTYQQLCVWEGTVLEDDEIPDFEKFLLDELHARVKLVGSVETGPGDGGEGGRTDLFFLVHDEDIPKFSVRRLRCGMRWWEDVTKSIYPEEFKKAYPPSW